MDYEMEQEMEIEALQAIFMDDLIEYEGTVPVGWGPKQAYKIVLTPVEDGEEDNEENPLRLEFLFNHTDTYPEVAPNVRLRSVFGLSDKEISEADESVRQAIDENLGMAMVYTLVETAKEWLRNKANVDDNALMGLSAEEAKKAEEEKAEEERRAQRLAGTPVNPETFKAWKEKFYAEMALQKASIEESKVDDKAGKMTGKEYFLRDEKSDAPFETSTMDEEDDETLYEDDDEDFEDYEDDDDDGMLDAYLAAKQST